MLQNLEHAIFTYSSRLPVLMKEISRISLPFPNGVEVNGPGINITKKKKNAREVVRYANHKK